MKTLNFISFLILLCVLALLLDVVIHREQPVEIELAQFEGILYDITYYSATDCFILVFTDGRVLKVDKQPNEGWVLAGIYKITIYARGAKIELMGSLKSSEKLKEDKANPNPGKAF